MKVALVHYWLVSMRGGEKVLESLCRMFPQSDIYTHVVDRKRISQTLLQHDIRTTFIGRIPGSLHHYQKLLPLMPLALEQLDLRDYDLVISSESGPAKGVITRADTAHICYCHSPMRYLWDMYPEYLAHAGLPSRLAMCLLFPRLRLWDTASAARVDRVIANSRNVARRVARWWGKEAKVIYPPVEIPAEPVTPVGTDAPYLFLGQLTYYKHADVAVKACTMSGRKLLVAGDGEELENLRHLAGPNVTFLGRVEEHEAHKLYRNCRAVLFPGEEDFGLVPVEAMANGRPVIAYARGGALETVRHGSTGWLFQEQNPQSLLAALDRFEQLPAPDPQRLRNFALRFSEERFQREMRAEIEDTLARIRQQTTPDSPIARTSDAGPGSIRTQP